MIRTAIESDFDQIIDMSFYFWKESPYKAEEFIAEHLLQKYQICMQNDLLVVSDENGVLNGFCAGLPLPLLANNVIKAGIEIAWWVKPIYRGKGIGKKIKSFIEQKAKEQGIKYWAMAHIENDVSQEVERIYNDSGYRKTETMFMKTL